MGDVGYITAQGPRLRNDLLIAYCVEWDVKLYYTIPYPTMQTRRDSNTQRVKSIDILH